MPNEASLWREKQGCPDQTVLANTKAGWKFPNETTPMFVSPFCSAEPQASKHGACQPPAPMDQPLFQGQQHCLWQPTASSCPKHPWGADLGPHAALFTTVPYPCPLCPLETWGTLPQVATLASLSHSRQALALQPSVTSEKAGPGRILQTFYLFIWIKHWEAPDVILMWGGSIFTLWDGKGRCPFRVCCTHPARFPPSSALLSLHN